MNNTHKSLSERYHYLLGNVLSTKKNVDDLNKIRLSVEEIRDLYFKREIAISELNSFVMSLIAKAAE